MKHGAKFTLGGSTLLLLGVGAALAAQSSDKVPGGSDAACTYYADANFSGQNVGVADGEAVNWIGGPWKDRISSVACAPGCEMLAYEHIDYGGASFRFSGNTRFVGPQWNDRISALRVSCRGRAEVRGCALFEHADYAGQRRDVGDGEQVGFVGPFWNDRISAMSCRPGCSAETFEHVDYAGESRRFSGETRFVGPQWNDRISSIRVNCRPR